MTTLTQNELAAARQKADQQVALHRGLQVPWSDYHAHAIVAAVLAEQVKAVPTQATEAMREAYKLGWILCANWAKRTDLYADIDSPAYIKDRDAALANTTETP